MAKWMIPIWLGRMAWSTPFCVQFACKWYGNGQAALGVADFGYVKTAFVMPFCDFIGVILVQTGWTQWTLYNCVDNKLSYF